MPKLKIVEPLYRKTPQGGIVKAGYRVNEIITKKNGDILKSTITRTKVYK